MAEEMKGAATADPRARIVDALMALAAERSYESITILDVAERAGVSLADFRDAFPSKGAILAGYSRRIDRAALAQTTSTAESSKERLFDVLMRRLDAMAPDRLALKEIAGAMRRDPSSALAMNNLLVNSFRFMLAAAGLEAEGLAGIIKLEGLVVAWLKVMDVWFEDKEAGLSKTMAALDAELTRGERAVAMLERAEGFTAPFHGLARGLMGLVGRRREDTRPPI